jgi:hypothetical protein
MSQIPYYKVSTSPKKARQAGKSPTFLATPKRKILFTSIVAIYLVASGLLGLFLFNQNNSEQALANNAAGITTSLRFVAEKQFTSGDKVEVFLTLQNTSVTESVENISLELLSSQESVKWSKATNKSSSLEVTATTGSKFNFSNLSFGERAEYLISGIYQDNSLDFLTILGKMKYKNSTGNLEIDTNRIYTNLNPTANSDQKLLSLVSNKDTYNKGENITITLAGATPEKPLSSDLKGKVFINRKNTSEVVASFDCVPESTGQCQFATANLGVGEYSSLFIGDNTEIKSNILWFKVQGATNNNSLVPAEQTTLVFPFQAASVNGLVPVVAQRVISQNQSPDNSAPCVFEVSKDGKLVNTIEATIEDSRSCKTDITTDQVGGAGVYKVKLANSGLEQNISFAIKPLSLVTLENLSPNSIKNQDISVKISGVKDEANNPVVSDNLKLKIYQKQLATVTEIGSINGEKLKITNGEFQSIIPGSNFSTSGNYLVYAESEAGRISDFVSINFNNSELAFSDSGIVVDDYSKLRVGENVNFKLIGIQDKQGQIVTSGNCTANFYTSSNGVAATASEGQIKNGVCNVTLPQGKINKAGPLLISFNNANTTNSLNQSKQVQLAPGVASDFGGINLEYEPAIIDFANTAMLGPVTDSYGNPTNSFNNQLVIASLDGTVVKEIDNVSIINGFAKVFIPASLVQEQFTLIFKDNLQKELLSQEFSASLATETLTVASIPNEVKNDSPINIGVRYTGEGTIDKCTLRFIKNSKQILTEEIPYDNEKQVCQKDWIVNQYRDQEQALVQILAGDKKYSKIVALTPGEAGNLFTVYPQVKFNKQKELQITLLSSPIVDSKGLPIKSGEMKWQYNGKIEKTEIKNGFAKLPILASKLESRDIRNNNQERYLDLDLNVSASISSVGQTNNLSVYLSDYDISTNVDNFRIKSGSNYISSQYNQILSFESQSCEAFILSNNFTSSIAKTHLQGNTCFVQTAGAIGENTLVFENNGFNIGTFNYRIGNSNQQVNWCGESITKCNVVTVKAPTTSSIEVIIYDGDNQYKFKGQELDNAVTIKQNGLNPIKEYLVETNYLDLDGRQIVNYNTILGEALSE